MGTGLAMGITLIAYFISDKIEFNTVLLALILGVIVGNVFRLPSTTDVGVKFSSGFVLELSIVLMGFGINYGSFIRLGWSAILFIVITMTIVLVATKLLAKRMDCPGSTGWLIGFGTAVCGSSAIAALAPRVVKDRSDIGIAMAVVNLYGLIGMVAIPFLVSGYLNDVQNSLLLGGSLHSVGNVAGAGMAISNEVGELAVTIKLGRVALLTPALLLFGSQLPNHNQTAKNAKLPWYLIGFLLLSITFSIIHLPEEVLSTIKHISSFLLAVAMAAIGLKVGLKSLLNAGKRGLIFGGLIFAIQLLVITGLLFALYR